MVVTSVVLAPVSMICTSRSDNNMVSHLKVTTGNHIKAIPADELISRTTYYIVV